MNDRYQHLLSFAIFGAGAGLYFLPLFTLDEGVSLTGFEAMNDYWIASVIFILLVIPILTHFIGWVRHDIYQKAEPVLIALINVLIILAALLVTYYSNIANLFTYLLVGLVIAGAYNQYRIKQ